MIEKTILVIDDSATIRRLVDGELGNAGYRVVMAATAEQGMEMARSELPDLILLDHQLPGTTGYELCRQFHEDPALCGIPVVCSSTLRKKAYAEYTELPNVIDMLPKPYSAELLRTIVANALETAAMVVHSQTGGTAVPEVIDEMADGDLSGTFDCFTMREVIDFLNNAGQQGVLEIDLGRARITVHLASGRVQALTASGLQPELISGGLPPVIADLAPMIKFTIRGRNSSEIDGLVDLLDNKVLDARLLRQVLRHQAAALVNYCLSRKPLTFRFQSQTELPKLFSKLPLDASLLALLVDASMLGGPPTPSASDLNEVTWVRAAQRGQNLDRGGLDSRYLKLFNLVSTPVTAAGLARQTGLPANEVHRVLTGFAHADLVTCQAKRDVHTVIAVTGDARHARQLSDFFRVDQESISGKVVRDALAVKLLARRLRPDQIVFDLDCDKTREAFEQLSRQSPAELADADWTVLTANAEAGNLPDMPRRMRVAEWPESLDAMRATFGERDEDCSSESSTLEAVGQ